MKLRKKTKKILTAPESFTIHRKDWLMGSVRSALNSTSLMLNSEGGMCCLGFLSYTCGIGSEDLLNKSYPQDVLATAQHLKNIPKLARNGVDTRLTDSAVEINDSVISLKEREEELTKLFKRHGIEVKFVGKYPEKVVNYDRLNFPEDYK